MTTLHMLRSLTMAFLISTPSFLVAAPAFAEPDPKVAAREHFGKGVAAYEERRFSDAAEEFETAYKLSRAFKILFNIGQVNVALGRPVDAVAAYDKYLKQGGATITAERRKEVQIEIEHQVARIGSLTVRTIPEGADVRIDGELVGKSPLPRAVRIAAGRHTVEAILPDHSPQVSEVEIAGRADLAVALALKRFVALELPPAPPPPAPAPVVPFVIMSPPPAPAPAPQAERTVVPMTPSAPSDRASASSSVNWQRVIGTVVLIGGLATATWGGVLAYRGTNQSNDAKDRLSKATLATPDAVWDQDLADFNAGKSLSQRGWIMAGVGTAVMVGGIVLVATSPDRQRDVALGPWMTAHAGGLVLSRAW